MYRYRNYIEMKTEMPTSDSGLNQIKLTVNSHHGIKESHKQTHHSAAMTQQRETPHVYRREEGSRKGVGVGMKQVLCLMITLPSKVVAERGEKVKMKADVVVPKSLSFFPPHSEK